MYRHDVKPCGMLSNDFKLLKILPLPVTTLWFQILLYTCKNKILENCFNFLSDVNIFKSPFYRGELREYVTNIATITMNHLKKLVFVKSQATDWGYVRSEVYTLSQLRVSLVNSFFVSDTADLVLLINCNDKQVRNGENDICSFMTILFLEGLA
jgi:hypothetical protein